MSYTKHNFQDGQVLTGQAMDDIDSAVFGLDASVEEAKAAADDLADGLALAVGYSRRRQYLDMEDRESGSVWRSSGGVIDIYSDGTTETRARFAPVRGLKAGTYSYRSLYTTYTHALLADGTILTVKNLDGGSSNTSGTVTIPQDFTLYATNSTTAARSYWVNGELPDEGAVLPCGMFEARSARMDDLEEIVDGLTDVKTETGALVTVQDAIAGVAKSLSVAVRPTQSGSGDPAPDNVREIVGRSTVTVEHSGKNLLLLNSAKIAKPTWWSSGWAGASISNNRLAMYDHPSVVGGFGGIVMFLRQGTYTVSTEYDFSGTENRQIYTTLRYYNGSSVETIRDFYTTVSTAKGSFSTTFELPMDAPVVIRMTNGGNVRGETVYFGDIQLEPGSTATEYEPYSGQEITLDIATPVGGTVYGGTLTVHPNGSATFANDIVYHVFNGTEGFSNYGSGDNALPRCNPEGAAVSGGFVVANRLKTVDTSAAIQSTQMTVRSTGGYVVFHFTDEMKGLAWQEMQTLVRAYLKNLYDNDTPLIIAYQIASPRFYTIPAEKLRLLSGLNNAYSDAGDVSLTYRAERYVRLTAAQYAALLELLPTQSASLLSAPPLMSTPPAPEAEPEEEPAEAPEEEAGSEEE